MLTFNLWSKFNGNPISGSFSCICPEKDLLLCLTLNMFSKLIFDQIYWSCWLMSNIMTNSQMLISTNNDNEYLDKVITHFNKASFLEEKYKCMKYVSSWELWIPVMLSISVLFFDILYDLKPQNNSKAENRQVFFKQKSTQLRFILHISP